MQEHNNQIKLTTIKVFITIIVIIIVSIVMIILKKNMDSKAERRSTVQIEDENSNMQSNFLDTDFSLELLKMENKKQNIIYSPLSIRYALQMLDDGANGNTKVQIENVIGNTNIVKYNNINNTLSLANVLFIKDTYSGYVKNEYEKNLIDKYNAEIKYDTLKSANNINSWIENKTFGQIKNMLRDETVSNSNNEMFLINAVAIDMIWKDKFDREDTYGDTFYLDSDNSMEATMMNKETNSDSISYYEDNSIKVLTMDLKQYDSEQMEFIAIMPNDNLSNYVENFSIKDLENIISKLTLASNTKYGLDVFIPKFSFDYDMNLKEDLKNLGITDAFNRNLADFSNMTNKKPFWVSDALHKANIDFSEEGIKATAGTVMYMKDESIAIVNEKKPIEIKIDKPFMYLIRDKKTDKIWFIGTVYEPNSWENNQAEY